MYSKSKVHKVHSLNCLLIIVSVEEEELHISLGQPVLASPSPHDDFQKIAWSNYFCLSENVTLTFCNHQWILNTEHFHVFLIVISSLLNMLTVWMHRSTTVFCPQKTNQERSQETDKSDPTSGQRSFSKADSHILFPNIAKDMIIKWM